MRTISRIAWMISLCAPNAYAQSDEELLEEVRANAVKIYLEQTSWTLPDSFHNSGLSPSDKERLIKQWADASGACVADVLAEYAETTEIPLSEMVSEGGSFSLKGDGSKAQFEVSLDACVQRAWAAVGASLEH